MVGDDDDDGHDFGGDGDGDVGNGPRGTGGEGSEIRRRRAREIGSGVAVRLWREMRRGGRPRHGGADAPARYDPATYLDAVRAICQTSEMPSTTTSAAAAAAAATTTKATGRALATLARVYSRCAEDGTLTPEITDLVRSATTESQFARLRAGAGGR